MRGNPLASDPINPNAAPPTGATATLDQALQNLDNRQGPLALLHSAWSGQGPVSFLSESAAKALDHRLQRLGVNLPRLVVTSMIDRMRVTGFRREGNPDADRELWRLWRRANLVAGSELVHADRALFGAAYVTVWGAAADPRRPVAMLDSPRTAWANTDPATGEVTEAVRRWRHNGATHAVLFQPDKITRWRTDSEDAGPGQGWRYVSTSENGWGEVPMTPLIRRTGTDDHDGTSAVADVLDLTDALAKVMQDALVTSEYFARPRRWATGLEIVEDESGKPVDPFGERRLLQSEDPDTRFGQLDPAGLDGYADLSAMLTQHVGALTGLPPHYLGLHGDQPANADGIRAAETQLVSRAYSEQRQADAPWARVAAWLDAIANATPTLADDFMPIWSDPETRTPAQAADAAGKLESIGVPLRTLLRDPLRYEPHEVDDIMGNQSAALAQRAGLDLSRLLS